LFQPQFNGECTGKQRQFGCGWLRYVIPRYGTKNMTKRILIDTDPGIDDALAILLALASPEIALEGLTIVHGNCSVEQGTKNALAILELAQAGHIPVAQGCDRPLVQPSLLAPETHGQSGLG